MVVEGGAFGRWGKGGALLNEISALIREAPKLHHVRILQEVCNLKEMVAQPSEQHTDLRLPVSWTMRNKFLPFISHSWIKLKWIKTITVEH